MSEAPPSRHGIAAIVCPPFLFCSYMFLILDLICLGDCKAFLFPFYSGILD